MSHGSMYCNRTAATDFISFQANEVLTKLREDVGKSKFYSILFDSTTDNTVIKQEAVLILYFDPAPAEPQSSDDLEPMVKVRVVSIDREFDELGCPRSTGCIQEIT